VNGLRGWAGQTSQSAQSLLGLEVAPFVHDQVVEERLKQQLKSWLVQNEIRNSPGVQKAIKKVVERRNAEVDEDSPI